MSDREVGTRLLAPLPPPNGADVEAERDRRTGHTSSLNRGRWNGWLYLVASPPALLLFVVTVVGISLAPLTAGVLLLAVAVPLTRRLADLHRHEAERLLGEAVAPPYRETTATNWLGRMAQRGRDRQSWRDLLWLFVASTLGFALSILATLLFVLIPWYLIGPLLMWVTPDGTFDTNYGIFVVDTIPESFLQYVLAGAAFLLWWFGAPHLMRLRARLDRALLGPTSHARALEAPNASSTIKEP